VILLLLERPMLKKRYYHITLEDISMELPQHFLLKMPHPDKNQILLTRLQILQYFFPFKDEIFKYDFVIFEVRNIKKK
jgi:hypothetical protein